MNLLSSPQRRRLSHARIAAAHASVPPLSLSCSAMAAILHAKPLVEFLPKHFCAHFGTAQANETIHLKLANDLMLFDNTANGRGDVKTRKRCGTLLAHP